MLIGVLAPEAVAILAIIEWFEAWGLVRKEPHLPTITHGFFAVMGGYAVKVEGTTEEGASRCIRLHPRNFSRLVELKLLDLPSKVELMDKSKGNWISKSITSIQVIWFVSQLVGRAIQRLPVTTLELFTCAIVVCTVATYIAWWYKPLDVQRPMVLDSKASATPLAQCITPNLVTYRTLVGSGGGSGTWMGSLVVIACFLLLFAFAACHLIGWNFAFPTWSEQLLWRAASVLCIAIPIFIVVSGWVTDGRGLGSLQGYVLGLGMIAYALIRTYLLVEAFVGLRSVPADVYRTVNWAAYIPHI